MPGKSITRTLYVKKVRYASGRQQNFVPPDIHTLLSQALSYTGTVGDRHVPPPGNLQDVDRCGFINRSHNVTNGGLMLEFCSYQPGHSPMQGEADFDRDQIDVKAEPLTDPDTGTKREMLTVASCYAFGQAMIVEAPKGSGGVGWLQKCLTELVRRHIDHQHPSIHLMDVAQHGLTETIERGGGVSEVIMDLEHAAAPEDSKYAKSLSEIRTKLRGTDLLRASFRTKNGTLRTEDVIDAYDEMNDDSVDKVVLVLNSGDRVDGLEKYKLRKPVAVQSDGNRNPNRHELEQKLKAYMAELQQVVEERRVLTTDGAFA